MTSRDVKKRRIAACLASRDVKKQRVAACLASRDIKKRRIAACLAICEGEEFTLERLESGAFNLRELTDKAFLSAEAHTETMGKLLAMKAQCNELMATLEAASKEMSEENFKGAEEIIRHAIDKRKQHE